MTKEVETIIMTKRPSKKERTLLIGLDEDSDTPEFEMQFKFFDGTDLVLVNDEYKNLQLQEKGFLYKDMFLSCAEMLKIDPRALDDFRIYYDLHTR